VLLQHGWRRHCRIVRYSNDSTVSIGGGIVNSGTIDVGRDGAADPQSGDRHVEWGWQDHSDSERWQLLRDFRAP